MQILTFTMLRRLRQHCAQQLWNEMHVSVGQESCMVVGIREQSHTVASQSCTILKTIVQLMSSCAARCAKRIRAGVHREGNSILHLVFAQSGPKTASQLASKKCVCEQRVFANSLVGKPCIHSCQRPPTARIVAPSRGEHVTNLAALFCGSGQVASTPGTSSQKGDSRSG